MKKFLILVQILLISQVLKSQHTINFEVLTGIVHNFKSTLTIRQDGFETIRIKARYRSEPFHLPPYYDFRLSLWKRDSSAWGLKFTHHKLILDNPTPVVYHFEITHGYNIFSITRMWKRKDFIVNAAMGAVIANPQSTINGLYFQGGGLFNNGYYLSGAVGELAISKQLNITHNWYLSGEVRFTGAWARVKIHSGYAEVPNKAVHFLFGTGYRIVSRHNKKWYWGRIRE